MQIQKILTKENFFNEMMETYPKATNKFCEWIDEYKKAVYWDMLFCNKTYIKPQSAFIKFHSIPYAMQQGIWIEFAQQTLNEYFEQPEYTYSFDLAEDIKTVFKEMEEALKLEKSEA